MEEKWDKKDKREHKAKYGHTGTGSSKTREIAPEEVLGAVRKAKEKKNKNKNKKRKVQR